MPSHAGHPSIPPLVGRAGELATLVAALYDAEAGRGSTVFVVGESGIGKTRLVVGAHRAGLSPRFRHRRRTRVSRRDRRAVRGLLRRLLPLLRALEPSVVTLLTRGGTAELAQLFPALASGERTWSAPPPSPRATLPKRRHACSGTSRRSSRATPRECRCSSCSRISSGPTARRWRCCTSSRDSWGTPGCSSSARTTIRTSVAVRPCAAPSSRCATLTRRGGFASDLCSRMRVAELLDAVVRRRSRARRRVRRAPPALDGRKSVLHRRNTQGPRR